MLDNAAEVAEAAGEMAGDALDAAGDVAGDIVDGVGDLAGDVGDAVGDVAEDVAEDVGEVARDAVEAAGDLAESAAEAVADAVDGADVVEMYAGAGPRDLDDGGPTGGGAGAKVHGCIRLTLLRSALLYVISLLRQYDIYCTPVMNAFSLVRCSSLCIDGA